MLWSMSMFNDEPNVYRAAVQGVAERIAVQELARELLIARMGTDRDVGTFTVRTAFEIAERFVAESKERGSHFG